jgi:putative ABC transport system permease protein
MALSLTFVLGLGGYMGATKLSMTKWMDNILTSDIYVRASANFIRPDFIFPASLKDELMNIPGVEAIESYRGVRPEYKGRNILVNSIDFGPYMDRSKNEYIQGDDASIRQGLVHEGKCAVSENFYRIFGLGMGQEVELMTPGGLVKIPIAAVVRDYNSDQGTIILDRPTFLKLWKDDRVDTFDVSVKPGVDIETVRTEIRKILAGRYPSILSTRHEFIVEITRAIDAFYALTQITVFLALGVAFLGIVASLLISVVERTREIGILKALGALSGQITRSIVLEALALSFVSLVLAIPAGNLFAHFMEGPVAIMFSGWSMPHCYPVATLTQLLIALPLVSVLAAWVPARQALNLKVTEAIEYE